MASILGQGAALGLTREQSDSLAWLSYRFGIYGFPVELRAMFKYISYRRPELEGL